MLSFSFKILRLIEKIFTFSCCCYCYFW
uniref:Uncharacterized protein n=1 Tax=Rhizophora mucronata TaxID=61149 RepID=A0A2P2PF20_RHIMU